MSLDPNLLASLARQYCGGVIMPSGVAQAGYVVRVNAAGDNFDYVPQDGIYPVVLHAPDGVAEIATINYVAGTQTTTGAQTKTLAVIPIPTGSHTLSIFVSAFGNDGSYEYDGNLLIRQRGTLTTLGSTGLLDSTINGAHDVYESPSNTYNVRAVGHASDTNALVWNATCILTSHG